MSDEQTDNEAIDAKPDEILVVDDEDRNLQLLGSSLSRAGYQVVFASSGREALDAVKAEPPDIILLDVMMPGMDGIEVCRRLKDNPETQAIPVIFITARTSAEDIVRGFEVGGQDYIAKPFKSAEMLARVRTHLQLKKSRERVERSKAKVEEVNGNQRRFFSILSHDLRGPLYVVDNLMEHLIDEYGDFSKEEILEMLQSGHGSIKQVITLVEDVLNWARVQMDDVTFSPQDFVLSDCILSVLSGLELTASSKNIKLIEKVPEDLLAYGDIKMIGTVIRNLVGNALKFTPSEGEIKITAAEEEGNVRIAVSDTGVGISPERLEKLFRIEENTSTKGTNNEKGSGLGLSLCRILVEKHGGRITARSTLGVGSTFAFTLPKGPDSFDEPDSDNI